MRSAVIVAGGKSVRYGKDKLSEQILGRTVLSRSVEVFLPVCDQVVVVGEVVPGTTFVPAGETRFQSVKNGLAAVDKNCTLVAVHDAARPFVSRDFVMYLFDEASHFGSAVPSVPVTDTVWNVHAGELKIADRSDYVCVQTPQVFDFAKLKSAVESQNGAFTDESTLYYACHGSVHLCEGAPNNVKITNFGDLPRYKVGCGDDVHAFGEGNEVIIGGVHIPFGKKLVGHSDADVLCHAVCDAILSASGNDDIGHRFPPTDNKYLGADSIKLLADCVSAAKESGFEAVNVSAVIVCQQPKMAPYLPQMAANIATVLGITADCVNLSATTTEKLGMLGNGDGIAVQAIALLKSVR